MRAVLELPVAKKAFGGIVGSRVEISGESVLVQIAYLERGSTARVRFSERKLPLPEQSPRLVELKLADINVIGGDEKTELSLNIKVFE